MTVLIVLSFKVSAQDMRDITLPTIPFYLDYQYLDPEFTINHPSYLSLVKKSEDAFYTLKIERGRSGLGAKLSTKIIVILACTYAGAKLGGPLVGYIVGGGIGWGFIPMEYESINVKPRSYTNYKISLIQLDGLQENITLTVVGSGTVFYTFNAVKGIGSVVLLGIGPAVGYIWPFTNPFEIVPHPEPIRKADLLTILSKVPTLSQYMLIMENVNSYNLDLNLGDIDKWKSQEMKELNIDPKDIYETTQKHKEQLKIQEL